LENGLENIKNNILKGNIMGWTDNENAKKAYSDNLKSVKEENKKERERLSKIKDFEKGQKVQLKHKDIIYNEVILRGDSLVNIDKEYFNGYPKYIIDSKTGDGRRYVGENVTLLKGINIYDEVED
jgi:hypothetical protein